MLISTLWKDNVWTFGPVFEEDTLKSIYDRAMVSNEGLFHSDLNKHQTAMSYFRYRNVHDHIRDGEIKELLLQRLDVVLTEIEGRQTRIPRDSITTAFRMNTRRFEEGSYIALHAESASPYGPYAFVVFLTDEPTGGELIFTDRADTEKWYEKYPQEREEWETTVSKLGDYLRFPEKTIRVQPKRNTGCLFHTGSPHAVLPVQEWHGKDTRLSINGWILTEHV